MWNPQAIVAVILALCIVVALVGAAIIRALGHQPAKGELELWLAFLALLAGGLLSWLGTGRDKGD